MIKLINNQYFKISIAILMLSISVIAYLLYFNQNLIYSINQHHIVYKFYLLLTTYSLGLLFIWNSLKSEKIKFGANYKLFPEIVISILAAFGYFLFWKSDVMVDDAGFVIKHMNNFAEGYFFTFNPQDGPVFGISGFFHNVLAGFFAFFKIFSPINSVLASNFIGFTIFGISLFRIIDYYTQNSQTKIVTWLVATFISERFLIYIKQGLETHLHIAIILFAVYFFLKRDKYAKWMWLFFVLSLISKLDSILIIVSLSVFVLYEKRKELLDFSFKNKLYNEFFSYAIIPGVIWIIFTMIVFGSPIPQTATAKILIHQDSSNVFFPYLNSYLQGDYHFPLKRLYLFVFVCINFIFITVLAFINRYDKEKFNKISSFIIPTIIMFLYIIPYFFFNPYEKMGWYYVFPDFLLLFQVILILIFYSNLWFSSYYDKFKKGYSIIIAAILISLVFSLLSYRYIKIARPYVNDIYAAENVRMNVGKWLALNSEKDDVLLTGFGHISAFSELHTIDYAGLNSKVRTDILNMDTLVTKYKPDWIVSFNMPTNLIHINRKYFYNNYKLVKSFYGFPAWRIYKKNLDSLKIQDFNFDTTTVFVDNSTVEYTKINHHKFLHLQGKLFKIQRPDNIKALVEFIVGVYKIEIDSYLEYTIFDKSDSLLLKQRFDVSKKEKYNYKTGYVTEFKIDLSKIKKFSYIIIRSFDNNNQAVSIQLTEPIYRAKIE